MFCDCLPNLYRADLGASLRPDRLGFTETFRYPRKGNA